MLVLKKNVQFLSWNSRCVCSTKSSIWVLFRKKSCIYLALSSSVPPLFWRRVVFMLKFPRLLSVLCKIKRCRNLNHFSVRCLSWFVNKLTPCFTRYFFAWNSTHFTLPAARRRHLIDWIGVLALPQYRRVPTLSPKPMNINRSMYLLRATCEIASAGLIPFIMLWTENPKGKVK